MSFMIEAVVNTFLTSVILMIDNHIAPWTWH